MKNFKFLSWLFLLVGMAVTMVACGGSDDKDEPATLTVSPSSISMDADGGSTSLTINSNTGWIISGAPSWATVTPSSGSQSGSVTITATANSETTSRVATLGVMTTDGSVSRDVTITQAAKQITLSVDVTSIMLPSTAGASQSINISSNDSWTLSNIPDWLQASSMAGNGNSSITITTRSANESASERNATMTLSSGTSSVNIFVAQEAGLANCKVTPSNITCLYYGVAFGLEYSSTVATCKILMVSDYDYKHLTEAELIKEVESESSQIPEDQTIYSRSVVEDTQYHILALAYDSKGNRGELTDVTFTSPNYLDGTKDAWCSISDASYSSTTFRFYVSKQGYCFKYDLIYGANIYSGYINALVLTYEINYYKKNGVKNWLSTYADLIFELNYPNDHQFSCSYSPTAYYGGVVALTWGMFEDGTMSSDVSIVGADTYDTSTFSKIRKGSDEAEQLRAANGWVKISPKDFNF